MGRKKRESETIDRINADSEAAIEVVDLDRQRDVVSASETMSKEELIAQTYQYIGRIETAGLFKKLAAVSSLVWLKQVKETQIYKDLPGMGTWEKFCNHLGKSRRHVDRDIENLDTFGAAFLNAVSSFSLGYRDLKKLSFAVKDGEAKIEDDVIEINGTSIPLTPDHAEELQTEIESLIEAKNKSISEQKSKLKAKDRILKEKERVIQRQEKDLAKYEKTLGNGELSPEEETFISEMDEIKNTITGYGLQLDPDNMPEKMSPVMSAALLEALGFIRQVVCAHHDRANEMYAVIADFDWTPPSPGGNDRPPVAENSGQSE